MKTWFIYFLIMFIFASILEAKVSSPRQGASPIAQFVIVLFAVLGYLSSLAQIIMAFWHIKWWQVLLSAISAYIPGLLFGAIFTNLEASDSPAKNGAALILLLLSIVGVIVFGVLSFRAIILQ